MTRRQQIALGVVLALPLPSLIIYVGGIEVAKAMVAVGLGLGSVALFVAGLAMACAAFDREK